MYSDLEKRELFHFFFLERLLKSTDNSMYALKGGVNLRFFLKSPRYSEDMDLDVFRGNVETLKKNGYKILEDKSFLKILSAFGIIEIKIGEKNSAKHTDTVQRFKVNLTTETGIKLPTKIEFSRRKSFKELVVLEKIDEGISNNYHRIGFFCPHYTPEAAFFQKIEALAGRSETQARDLFDLDILISNSNLNLLSIKENLEKFSFLDMAIEKAEEISFEDFKGQVIEFISEEKRELFSGKRNWEKLRSRALGTLYEFV